MLFVGALDQQKGIEVLFNAFNRIKRKNICLHIVGAGKLEETLKNITNKLKLNDIIHFYGHQDSLKDYYFSADLVIVPSVDGEGSSGVIKEAMALGKTVIASDLESNLELFDDMISGVYFKNRNENDLYEKIESFFNENIILDPSLIKEKALHFSKEKMINEHIKLYKNFTN